MAYLYKKQYFLTARPQKIPKNFRFEATDKEQLEKIQNIFEEKLSKYL